MSADSPIGWVAIDFLAAILLVVYTLIAPPVQPASIDTLGHFAVEVTWSPSRDDDIDTYVEDPSGNVVSFTNADVALMHLEHDDLGKSSDEVESKGRVTRVNDNRERVVLRGTVPGEVTVNVHAYRKISPGATRVRVVLYRLRGEDKKLLERTVALSAEGQEATVFRFSVAEDGELVGHNTLTKSLVWANASPDA